MHSYPKHIGDYAKAAMNLTLMADLAYRRMLDRYYDSEKPLVADPTKVAGLIGMDDHAAEVMLVLDRHFTFAADGCWHNKRADEVIAAYHAQLETASKAGKASAVARRLNPRSTTVERPLNTRTAPVKRPLNDRATPVERPSNERATTVAPTNNLKPEPLTQGDSVSPLRSETARAAQFGNRDQWKEALDGFGRQGVSERSARAHIGKLIQDFGQEQAFRLLHAGMARNVVDLAAYVEGVAAPLRKSDAYLTSHTSDEDIERQNNRGARPV